MHDLLRATVDIDLVLSLRLADYELAEKTLKDLGLQSRIPVRAKDIILMREEYIKERNLIAWSFVDSNKPYRQVDILITEDLKNIESQFISVGGRKINVVTLKKLLEMKLKSGRPQDLVDAENIKGKIHEKK
ncbi:MAG: hypothetical protein H7235_01140 [Bdellovibrionaceae bacterium]|nr:hypothetical protein [Pseudobdellovibrionaceae bacterium]